MKLSQNGKKETHSQKSFHKNHRNRIAKSRNQMAKSRNPPEKSLKIQKSLRNHHANQEITHRNLSPERRKHARNRERENTSRNRFTLTIEGAHRAPPMTEIQKACHFLTFSTVFHRIFTTFTSSGSGPLTPGSGWVCVVLPNRRVVSPYRVVRLVENSVRPSVFSPSSCCPLLAFFFFLLLSFSLLVADLFSRSFCLLIFFQVAAGFFLFSFSLLVS